MTHSWLITGPAGSGRSNLAYAFATALLSGNPDGDDATAAQVAARSHPDLQVLTAEGVIIKIADVRETVRRSRYSPSVGPCYRVIIVEDADRMAEHAPTCCSRARGPERTVWILCAPARPICCPRSGRGCAAFACAFRVSRMSRSCSSSATGSATSWPSAQP